MWGFGGVDLTLRIIRFGSSIMVSLVFGIVFSSLLAVIAHAYGHNGEAVFNVFGLTLTAVCFLLLGGKRHGLG